MVEVLHLRRKQVLLMEVQITHKPLLHLMGHTEQHLPLWEETQAQLEVTGLTHPLEVPEEAIQKVTGEVAMVGAGATVVTAEAQTVTDLEEAEIATVPVAVALMVQLPSLVDMVAAMEVQVEAMEAEVATAEEAVVVAMETAEVIVEAAVDLTEEAAAAVDLATVVAVAVVASVVVAAAVNASCLTTKSMPPAFQLTSLKKTLLNSLAPLASSRTTKELANPRFGFTNIATQATRKAKPL